MRTVRPQLPATKPSEPPRTTAGLLTRCTGYHARGRIEAKMRLLKAFGGRIAAQDPDCQPAEFQIRIALMKPFSV